MTGRQKIQCSRCKRRASEQTAIDQNWNMTMRQGVCVGFLCNNCQTVAENTEAEINAATTSYGVDSFGRAIGFPKAGEQS